MKKIDTKLWLDFRVGDLFETIKSGKQVPTGASISKIDLKENGSIPRITVSGINNGIIGYFDYAGKPTENYRVYDNFISVSFLGTVFYHCGEASLDMKVHCLKPINISLNKYTGQFLVSAIKSSLRQSSYADQISSTVLPDLTIKLPATSTKQPDWLFMEEYMKNIEERVKHDIILIINALGGGKSRVKIDTTKWRKFKIGSLFPNIIKPQVYHTHQVQQNESGIPYIVRSKFDNGIKYRVSKLSLQTSPAGVISFGAENSAFFYQEEEWCSGRDIYYIDTRSLSPLACRFLLTCLQKISAKYSYNYGLFPDLLKEEFITLPTTSDFQPDWDYMEKYMGLIERTVKDSFQSIKLQVS